MRGKLAREETKSEENHTQKQTEIKRTVNNIIL